MSSIMSYSSSSVTDTSASPFVKRAMPRPMAANRKYTGLKTAVKNFSDSAVARQTRSARRTSRHLGMASARKNTSSAAHTAATAALHSGQTSIAT